MQSNADIYLSQLNKSNHLKSSIRQTLKVLSLAVVLVVFWGLKLTGITLAGEAFCGMEEHTHGEDCPIRTLICTREEVEPHIHSEACIHRELICETAECDPHTHSFACKSATLICTIEETEGHTHSESCQIKTLVCTTEETPGHLHSPQCYGQVLTCTAEEIPSHSHDDACYCVDFTCGQEEIPAHTHDNSCMTDSLVCTLAEDETHTHDDSCYTKILSCDQAETEGHTHSDACKTLTLVCTLEEIEGHTHEDLCYTEQLLCTLEEHPEHTHSDECYSIEPGYGCGLEEIEPHTHTEECYTVEEGVFICGLEETEGHTHAETCWQAGIVFSCGMNEADGHIHGAECLVEAPQLGCGKEATEGHIHGEECYDILESCPLEEHTHTVSCYSDINADLETSDDWEMSLAGLTRSSSTAENIITVAKSQLGCSESIRNFQVDEFGVRRGITRYGQWYGNPYGDWSAMFASFCLYYAGVDELPINAGPESMRLEWEAEGLYRPAADFAPVAGHILFLDKNADGSSDAVAVITAFEDNIIHTIEGDIPIETEAPASAEENEGDDTASQPGSITVDMVVQTAYPVDDPAILGYGLVPFEPELMVLPADTAIIAKTTAYNTGLFTNTNNFVLYTVSGGAYYAFDGTGNAVPIYIDAQGNISTDLDNTDLLLWSIIPSGGTNSYLIQNKGSGRYMHAYSNASGTSVTTTGTYPSTFTASGSGVRIQGNGGYPQLNTANGTFQVTSNYYYSAEFQFGITSNCTVWLDGTNGGIMALGGSPNSSFTVPYGGTMVLPDQWQSPDKYSYKLQGWYDVINNKYYQPGEEIVVTDYMVFYADWVAATYNIGRYNGLVADTVSTNDFVTTRMFDYGVLFNVLSSRADVSVSSTGHSEVWNLLTSGTNPYNNEQTLNFIFRDWDRGNEDISYPANYNDQNHYTGNGVYPGLYSSRLHDILFNPSTQVIGKHYLGTGDHLFQLMDDPSHPYHGYYYYDSELNAASYSQSAGRFYVYDYLSRTSDSADASGGKYSDFLPLNSPYANTNGNTLRTYSYNGESGEYVGTTHYTYDAKYNTGNDTADYVGTNYYFGMSIDIDFYLPNTPGYVDSSGSSGNRDLYGKEMHFHFSGDDDVWILVDGQVVLDIGGIHGIEHGDINFSTGVVTQNGVQIGNVNGIGAGDHKLTILYLERGSSQSNCAIFFNLAPRFSFSIQKEDVLTQEVLNGAQFSVYLDRACTKPADLWTDKASHKRGDPATNVFTVTNGVANMWGMGAGNTYYIKETKPPDNEEYTYSHGIISVTIDKQGLASYHVELLDEENSDGTTTGVSGGFTVHGFRIDEESQQAYIIATNAPEWAREVTSVYVQKRWNDSLNHDATTVTVYLTVTDPDGTVRQIRETQLGKENGWAYTWENLPKYDQNGDPVVYGVQEVSVPGYMGTVEKIDPPVSDGSGSDTGTGGVTNAGSFENGQTYLLSTKFGYVAAADNKLQLIGTEAEALASNTAQWVATVNSDGTVVLVNKAGQTFYYSNYAFRASSTPESTKNLHFFDGLLSCTIQHSGWSETQYPVDNSNVPSNITYNSVLYSSNNSAEALIFTPQKLGAPEPDVPDPPEVSSDDLAYRITNTPLESETSVTVQKAWDYGSITPTGEHEQAQVTVKLMANGLFTGRTVTLSLKNNWKATFNGLPYTDSEGNVIHYTVEENWKTEDWIPYYGDIITSSGDPPTYSTTITNVYRWGIGEVLPSTGTAARMLYILCGSSLMLLSLVLGIGLRRKRERRME